MTTISGRIRHQVVLNGGTYTSPLKISPEGSIAPANYATAALYVPRGQAGVYITNHGHITGSAPSDQNNSYFPGGSGIGAYSPATISNTGTISGGGRSSSRGDYGARGVSLEAGSSLTNSGVILGGGNAASTIGLNGGEGVLAKESGVSNTGTISGGSGEGAGGGGRGSYGGYGASLYNASTLGNAGIVTGGYGSFEGGIGVRVNAACTLYNQGTITGGSSMDGAGSGVLLLQGGTLLNMGTIIGGAGGEGDGHNVAGIGVFIGNGTLVNSGILQGGAAAADNGGSASDGAGLVLSNGAATNSGRIASGGTAVDLSGGALVNTGHIIGGTIGVDLTGGTLTTSGAISSSDTSAAATAILLDPNETTATLVIDPTATFRGIVQADPNGIAILELAGSTPGTIGHIGTAFTGFQIIETASYSKWTFKQADTVAAATSLIIDGQLTVAGLLQDEGALTIRNNGTLTVASAGVARAVILNLQGGTLAGAAGGKLAIGDNVSTSQAGAVTVDPGGTISGYGTITAPGGVLDNGIIAALADPPTSQPSFDQPSLAIETALSGTGGIVIHPGAILQVTGALTIAKLAFAGPGQLCLGSTQPTPTQITGFSTNDTITLNTLTANTATYADGTLSLYEGTTLADQLKLAGPYTTANFAIQTANNTTTITYAPTSSASHPRHDALLAWHTPHG